MRDLAITPLLGDGCVLQRDQPIPIRGRAEPGAAVTVGFRSQQRRAAADATGVWRVLLDPETAGGPDVLVASSGDCVLSVRDVLVGDVWFASGQSNMEMTVAACGERYAGLMTAGTDPLLRFVTIPRRQAPVPLAEPTGLRWQAATPDSILECSAVAWFFARRVRAEQGVPVGLVCCAWGGTNIEAWMSPDALAAFPQITGNLVQTVAVRLRAERHQILARWRERADACDAGLKGGWAQTGHDDADWTPVRLPFPHAYGPLADVVGVVWYRRHCRIPEAWRGRKVNLYLASIDHFDELWVNGVKVAETPPDSPKAGSGFRCYTDIPPERFRPGEDNVIAVRVYDIGGNPGGIWQWGNWCTVQIEPEGHTPDEVCFIYEDWRWRVGYDGASDPTLPPVPHDPGDPDGPNWPSLLWHGMIQPLLPLPLRGVIWYQGEANEGDPAAYRQLFPALIRDWRNAWNSPALPFLFVQLANHGRIQPRPEQPAESTWAEVREAQEAALYLPATGMAGAIDVGDSDDIHPKDKLPVGERLARAARAVTYGDASASRGGPRFAGWSVGGDGSARVHFQDCAGLRTRDGAAPRHVAVSGLDQIMVWAEARICDDELLVRHPAGTAVTAVRYAWDYDPVSANLVDAAGEPVAPFRTDSPGETPPATVAAGM
jgi:sialate O-acetylesterase